MARSRPSVADNGVVSALFEANFDVDGGRLDIDLQWEKGNGSPLLRYR